MSATQCSISKIGIFYLILLSLSVFLEDVAITPRLMVVEWRLF